MSWPRVALRTMPYPDKIELDLELIWFGELPHADDLTA